MQLREMTRWQWVADNAREPILDIGRGEREYYDEEIYFIEANVSNGALNDEEVEIGDSVEVDPESLPFDDNRFNTVVVGEVLEYADNPIAVIMEAKRVAANKVLIIVPDENRGELQPESITHGERKRQYSGSLLAHQLITAGVMNQAIEIKHLNEHPFSFWLAECDIMPDMAMQSMFSPN